MISIKKLLYKPKKDDNSLLAQFYHVDQDIISIISELDSFDGTRDPTRCVRLVSKLKDKQSCMLKLLDALLLECLDPNERASRDFRCKFPEELNLDQIEAHLWLTAECMIAGSSLRLPFELDDGLRVHACEFLAALDVLRKTLRQLILSDQYHELMLRSQLLHAPDSPKPFSLALITLPASIKTSLLNFEKAFLAFEYRYVSSLAPVKKPSELEFLWDLAILFSETMARAVANGLFTMDDVEAFDPTVMVALPRLVIVSGLVLFPDSVLNPLAPCNKCSEGNTSSSEGRKSAKPKSRFYFKEFETVLRKIKDLLPLLQQRELALLEQLLAQRLQLPDGIDTCLQYKKERQAAAADGLASGAPRHHRRRSSAPRRDARHSSPSAVELEPRLLELARHQSAARSPPPLRPPAVNVQSSPPLPTVDTDAADPFCVRLQEISRRLQLQSRCELVALNYVRVAQLGVPVICCTNTVVDVMPLLPQSTVGPAESSLQPNAVDMLPTNHLDAPLTPIESSILSCTVLQPQSVNLNSCRFDQPVFMDQTAEASLTSADKCGPNVVLDGFSVEIDSMPQPKEDLILYSSNSSSDTQLSDKVTLSEPGASSACQSALEGDLEEAHAQSGSADQSTSSARFKGTVWETMRAEDINILHRAFVCICGVADQLQSAYASEIRYVLRLAMRMFLPSSPPEAAETAAGAAGELGGSVESGSAARATNGSRSGNHDGQGPSAAPEPAASPTADAVGASRDHWVADDHVQRCPLCSSPFNLLRRRHHCRRCGGVFCYACCNQFQAVPSLGFVDPVRLCTHCFFMASRSQLSAGSPTAGAAAPDAPSAPSAVAATTAGHTLLSAPTVAT